MKPIISSKTIGWYYYPKNEIIAVYSYSFLILYSNCSQGFGHLPLCFHDLPLRALRNKISPLLAGKVAFILKSELKMDSLLDRNMSTQVLSV